jgi:hypothetical protein
MDTGGVTAEVQGFEWRNHLALLVSAASVFFVVIRILVVSHFDITTARALVGAQGAFDIAVASLVPLASLIPLTSALVWLRLRMVGGRQPLGPSKAPTLVASLAIVVSLLLLPPIVVVVIPLSVITSVPTVAWVRHWQQRRGANQAPATSPYGRQLESERRLKDVTLFVRMIAVVVVTLVTVSPDPWVPTEKVTTTSGQEIVGSVMKEADSQLVILRDKDRAVIRLKGATVIRRSICVTSRPPRIKTFDLPDWVTRDVALASVIFFYNEVPDYPRCT